MDYTDFLLLKLALFTVAAFVWGLWRGLNGQPLGRVPYDNQAAQHRNSQEDAAKH